MAGKPETIRFPEGILLEVIPRGHAVRVAAIDPVTRTEIVFQAPATVSRREIDRLAEQKLRYRINRDREKIR